MRTGARSCHAEPPYSPRPVRGPDHTRPALPCIPRAPNGPTPLLRGRPRSGRQERYLALPPQGHHPSPLLTRQIEPTPRIHRPPWATSGAVLMLAGTRYGPCPCTNTRTIDNALPETTLGQSLARVDMIARPHHTDPGAPELRP